MSHDASEPAEIIPAIILVILTSIILVILIKKRRDTQVNALDWIITVFAGVFSLGIAQVLKLYFHDDIGIFGTSFEDTASGVEPALGNDLVRVLHIFVLITLYLMAEQFLSDQLHSGRLIVFSGLISIYIFITIYYVSTGTLIPTNEIFSSANDFSTIDHLIFDLIQLFSISLIFYVYLIQYLVTEDKQLKKYLFIIVIAVIVYLFSSLLEALEHFAFDSDVNAFMTAIPTFMILAFFYIRNPNFVYLAPCKIAFLQIVAEDGNLLYAAELKEEMETSDFLVAPSLTSVNLIIAELVSKEGETVEIKKFVYEGGYILFEKVANIRAILQTDRPARILKRSMRYFLREFNKQYADQIENYKGFIAKSDGISPDDLFRKCVPIVASKAIRSSFTKV